MRLRKQTILKEEKNPLKFQEKVRNIIMDNTSIPKDVAKIIAEYNRFDIEKLLNLLSASAVQEAKQKVRELDSNAKSNSAFFKSSIARYCLFMPEYLTPDSTPGEDNYSNDEYIIKEERVNLPFLAIDYTLGLIATLPVSAVRTLTHKQKEYNWEAIAYQLQVLEKLDTDAIDQFAAKCVAEYIVVKNHPTNNTHRLLKALQNTDGGQYSIEKVAAIEDFLMNPTNTNSRLYAILIEQLELLAYDVLSKNLVTVQQGDVNVAGALEQKPFIFFQPVVQVESKGSGVENQSVVQSFIPSKTWV